MAQFVGITLIIFFSNHEGKRVGKQNKQTEPQWTKMEKYIQNITDISELKKNDLLGSFEQFPRPLANLILEYAWIRPLGFLKGCLFQFEGKHSEAFQQFEQTHQEFPQHAATICRLVEYFMYGIGKQTINWHKADQLLELPQTRECSDSKVLQGLLLAEKWHWYNNRKIMQQVGRLWESVSDVFPFLQDAARLVFVDGDDPEGLQMAFSDELVHCLYLFMPDVLTRKVDKTKHFPMPEQKILKAARWDVFLFARLALAPYSTVQICCPKRSIHGMAWSLLQSIPSIHEGVHLMLVHLSVPLKSCNQRKPTSQQFRTGCDQSRQ